MAASAYLTVQDGKIGIPEELQREWHLHNGVRVEVVSESGLGLVVKLAKASRTGVTDWSIYDGILADLNIDLNADLEAERIREIELDNHV